MINDAQIQALRTEAGQTGDEAQVVLCDRALDGDDDARAECERVARSAVLEEDIRIPAPAESEVRAAKGARLEAQRVADEAAAKTATAARALAKAGLSLRDAGVVLDLSHERVKQLAAGAGAKQRRAG